MRRITTRFSCGIAFLLVTSFALAQTEFSADMVDYQKTKGLSRIYMGKDKVRFDMQGDERVGALISDFTSQKSLVLMPAQHIYMEMPTQGMEKQGLYHFFRAGDAENACPDWLALPWNKGATCHKIGSETVNGRSTVKYEGTNSNGESGTMWVDPKLRFPVKWQGKNGGGELRNIQEGPQPANLFEIPAGYTKFDMGSMMQRQQ